MNDHDVDPDLGHRPIPRSPWAVSLGGGSCCLLLAAAGVLKAVQIRIAARTRSYSIVFMKLAIPLLALALCGCVATDDGQRSKPASTDRVVNSATPHPILDPASNSGSEAYRPGEQWKLVWSDEFDGDTLDRESWNRQVLEAGRFNEELQEYTASEDNAYVKDGFLVIKAIHKSEAHGPNQYSSARLNTAQKRTWQYGIVAARIQLPHGAGMWPAFWMLGANCNENGGDTKWPLCGEIDILELYGSKNDAVVEGNLHFADERGAHKMMGAASYKLEEGKFADQFHVFEIEWDEQHITWRVDGKEYARCDISAGEMDEFRREFFILLNVAVGGSWAGRPDSTTRFPQHMYVDWVRVYQQ